MKTIQVRLAVLAIVASLTIACGGGDEDDNQTGGMTGGMTGGEMTGGMTGGEMTGGEMTGGMTGGEMTGGEMTGGMSNPGDLAEWSAKFNVLFYALKSGQERLCANCPDDNYCSEGMGDMPLPDELVSCILDNLNAEQLALLDVALDCQATEIATFEMCTAEPMCDGSYFMCLENLLNDQTCAPEGYSDIDEVLPSNLGVLCFGEIECTDGSGGYSEADQCDGFDDCENGEDEQGCQ